MKKSLAILLAVLLPLSVFASEDGYKVVYDGGSIEGAKTGAQLRLFIEQDKLRFRTKDGGGLINIPTASITEISYGQDVHRRVGAAIGLAVIRLELERSWHLRNPRSISWA